MNSIILLYDIMTCNFKLKWTYFLPRLQWHYTHLGYILNLWPQRRFGMHLFPSERSSGMASSMKIQLFHLEWKMNVIKGRVNRIRTTTKKQMNFKFAKGQVTGIRSSEHACWNIVRQHTLWSHVHLNENKLMDGSVSQNVNHGFT